MDNEAYRKIHLAVMAIESAARKMGIPGYEMFERLNRQGLVANRLFAHYDDLHTQSLDWVTDDTIESLQNWEAEA